MKVVQPIRDPRKVAAIEADLKARSARDWLMFLTGINTGLRISDVLQLKVGDVLRPAANGSKVARQYIDLKEKKTRKNKLIPMTPLLKRALLEYCADLAPGVYLFRSRQGGSKPITRTRAYQILSEAAARHNLEHIGTHTLRKTFGYHFYKMTKNVALLQMIFNHSDPAHTLRYIGIEQDQVDEAMARFKIEE